VRALAQRSAAAAKEIRALIGTSTGKVDVGTQLDVQAGRSMQEIVAIEESAAAAESLKQQAQQLNQTIGVFRVAPAH
jgi:methyl-accepting chemotaxis protein